MNDYGNPDDEAFRFTEIVNSESGRNDEVVVSHGLDRRKENVSSKFDLYQEELRKWFFLRRRRSSEFAQEHKETISRSVAAQRSKLLRPEYANFPDITPGLFGRDVYQTVRFSLDSIIHGRILASDFQSSDLDLNNLENSDIQKFLEIRLGVLFAALAQRYRYADRLKACIGKNGDFLEDIADLIYDRISVPTGHRSSFSRSVYRDMLKTDVQANLAGDWGQFSVEADKLFMEIRSPRLKRQPVERAPVTIRKF